MQTKLLTPLHMMQKQMTTAIQNRTAEAISVMITVLTIGKTVICALGSIQAQLPAMLIGFAETRRRMAMSAERVPIITKQAFLMLFQNLKLRQ